MVELGGTRRRRRAAGREVLRPRAGIQRDRPSPRHHPAGRRGLRGRPPRRGHRAARGRALRLDRARRGGHGDRGRADRLDHALGAGRRTGHRARHGLRRDHDRAQRHRRALPARRWHAPPRAGLPRPRGDRRARRARHACDARAHPAEPHHDDARPGLRAVPARLRRGRLAGALRPVPIRPGRAPPQLLHGRGRRRRAARAPIRPRGRAQLGTAPARARQRHPSGEDAVAGGGPRDRGRGASRRLRRHRDRRRRAAARGPRRLPRGAGQPPADEPQPRAGLVPGDDRPHDPGGDDRVAGDRRAAFARPAGRPRRAAGAVALREHADAGRGAEHRPAGRRPPRDLRGLPRDVRGAQTAAATPPRAAPGRRPASTAGRARAPRASRRGGGAA